MDPADRPLSCWVVTDGRAGIEAQALGLAEAIGRKLPIACEVKRIAVRAPWRRLPPALWGEALDKLAPGGDRLDPPYPDLVIGCGRLSVPLCLALQSEGVFAIQLQDPKWRARAFDLVVAPEHDRLSGDNVLAILGAANRITPERVRREAEALAAVPFFAGAGEAAPRIAVLIGGASKAYRLSPKTARAHARRLQALADHGARIAVTFSRRTPRAAAAQYARQLRGPNVWIWNARPIGALANPYPGLLGWADHVLVTEDSTNMLCEAASAGKPVHILKTAGGAAKFRRLHKALIDHGAARPFSGDLPDWSYMPLAETERAADEALARLRQARPGLFSGREPMRTDMSETRHAKVLILGSGPAGYTAAIYAARAMLEPLLVHGIQPGGQLTITTDVENYPGFADVIQGPWLMEQMQAQAAHVGVEMANDTIVKAELGVRPFRLIGDSGTTYTADALIICTGAQAKWLGLPSEQKFQGFGVSACATCDGFFYRGKQVAVVGGGNTAVEEALFLTNFAEKVTLIHRRDSLRAEKILQNRLLEHPKIEVIWNHVVDEVLGAEDPLGVTGLRLKHAQSGETQDISVDGFFVAIGHAPATELFLGQVDAKENGYLITAPDSTATNIPGVFAAGDVTDDIYRQAVTAAGMGCMAALEAEKYLQTLETSKVAAE